MSLVIDNPETERLARELAKRTGRSVEEAVTEILRKSLKPKSPRSDEELFAAVARIQAQVAELPVLDDRPTDEALGYDERGLPS